MLIRKMIIENFRQYKGKQEICFSTDRERNVTLFLGDNGAGKTVISQAFIWCFYGETPAFKKKGSLLSQPVEDEMYEGWDRPVNVTIFMEHSHKEYEVSRTIRYIKKNDKVTPQNPSFSITKIENGERKFLQGKELTNCINEILPGELSQYFFLSGEKIDSMSEDIQSGRPKDFANAVNTLLDLDYYRNAIKHLTNISKEYDVSTVTGLEDDLQNIISRIETNEANLASFTTRRDELTDSIESLNDEVIEYRSQLKAMTSAGDIQEKIDAEEKRIATANANIKNDINWGIIDFVQKIPYAFLDNTIAEMNETLTDVTKMESNDIPERLHAELIDWIENRGECICGNKITKHDKCYELLEKWRHVIPPESIGVIAKSITSKAKDKKAIGSGLLDKLKNYRSRIYDNHENIDDYNDRVNILKEELLKADDTSLISKKLYQAQEDLRKATQDKEDCITQLARINNDINIAKREKEKSISSNKEGQQILKWKNMTEKLLSNFERQIKKDEDEKRALLVDSVKKAFRKIYGDSFSINIDENYRITTNTELEKSTGQGMAVIFSFLAGLLDVIKTDKGKKTEVNTDDTEHIELESYPLVLDAPFSALDKRRITSICKVLPNVSEQIIIFIKDTDGQIAKEEMSGKIGASYILTKIGNSDIETIIEKEE